jgi:hypothetical protein
MLHLNSVLFDAEGDSLKNYFTYVYHVQNDHQLLNFTGLNYPFGEHLVYTDCQPLLTFILKLVPFTHQYLIGIVHAAMLLSFIVTPLVLFRIFMILKVESRIAFLSSLAIAFLSPQTQRLGGHFALAYGCVIPLGILFLLNFLKNKSVKNTCFLFTYNTLLFFVHPYFGLGLSIFSLTTSLIYLVISENKHIRTVKNIFVSLTIGLMPIILFKLFMWLTDKHTNRPDEPYGIDIMGAAANIESVFTPSFGPFIEVLKKLIKSDHVEWEAHSYIGLAPIILTVMAILLLPFYLQKINLRNELTALFATAILFLLFSFGLHIVLLKILNLEIPALNQFRAFGRFAWYFYFILPIVLVVLFSKFFEMVSPKFAKQISLLVVCIFFLLNLTEANGLLIEMSKDTFKSRNIFNKNNLSAEETNMIKKIKAEKFQAIIPLPVFHIGSEVYQRNGDGSLAPAMTYAYHTGLPILSVMLSRTSLNETESELEILNRFKEKRSIFDLINNHPFLIIKTGGELKEDELRLLRASHHSAKTSSLDFYTASVKDFMMSDSDALRFKNFNPDGDNISKNIIFIHHENRPPFIESNINTYQSLFLLDSNTVDSGLYTVSFHYHLKAKKFKYIHNHLIVVKRNKTSEIWQNFSSVRSTSGIYSAFIVVEERVKIDPHFNYELMLNGPMKETFHVSDFLLKPEQIDIKMKQGARILYDNYPLQN